MSKLYKVKFEFETVIYADTPLEAEKFALLQATQIVNNDDISSGIYTECEIKSKEDLPENWEVSFCIPWGKETDQTIAHILSESGKQV